MSKEFVLLTLLVFFASSPSFFLFSSILMNFAPRALGGQAYECCPNAVRISDVCRSYVFRIPFGVFRRLMRLYQSMLLVFLLRIVAKNIV